MFGSEGVTAITEEEVRIAVKKMKLGKAPGPDHVPNEVIRIAVEEFATFFARVLNGCLQEGQFPGIWKLARLVLVRKPNKCDHLDLYISWMELVNYMNGL